GERHARLVLAARSDGALREVAEECRRAGASDVIVAPTDISDADQVEEMFDLAVQRFGRIDVAAQCAAITAF
ncbi:SDR family oxidoreductase, partial [Mycobacterium rufum]|nr:SDR family oxidoreductase [Mycolicibacterium rufum]